MPQSVLTWLVLGLGGFLLASTANAEDSAQPPENFRSLFNGQDLQGWHGDNPHETVKAAPDERAAAIDKQQAAFQQHWSVENGELVNDGHGPYATTDEEFGDIEFRIEYKTVPKADSGIYLRGTPQVQIWDTTQSGGKWDIQANKGSGGLFNNSAGAAGQVPLVLADRPFGEWNEFRILQVGARTTVYLNDQLVVDNAIMENYWDRAQPLPAKGPIHLQTHGGEIRWRDLFVREIPAEEATAILRDQEAAEGFTSIFDGQSLAGWTGAVNNYHVVDGAIECRPGQGGVLHTEKEYADFIARVEFLTPPGGNNGLAIRYPGHGNAAYDGMTELQVLDNDAPQYSKLDPRQYHGSAYGMAAAARGYLRPAGQWNFQEVRVQGSKIRVELNGTVILDTDLSQIDDVKDGSAHPGKDLKKGFFGFAGHNDPVRFRNIAIKEL